MQLSLKNFFKKEFLQLVKVVAIKCFFRMLLGKSLILSSDSDFCVVILLKF